MPHIGMSNIYNLEPVTKGKVLLSTSHGDIEIELWAREVNCSNIDVSAGEGESLLCFDT